MPVAGFSIYVKRLGAVAFFFFLLKGLAWLFLPLVIYSLAE
jgi:hypothetical protein